MIFIIRGMFPMKTTVIILALTIFCIACSQSGIQPKMPSDGVYIHTISQSGETLAGIAKWYTGASSNWVVIQNANPDLKPNKMRVGTRIHIPQALMIRREPMPKQVMASKGSSPEVAKNAVTESTSNSNAAQNSGTVANVSNPDPTPAPENIVEESSPPSMPETAEAKETSGTEPVNDFTANQVGADQNSFGSDAPSPEADTEHQKTAPSVTSILGAFGKALVAPDSGPKDTTTQGK